jgi:hypothetical protein
MSRKIAVERANNGWIVTDGIGHQLVFEKKEDMLLEVYRQLCDWKIYERVEVKA